MTSALAGGLIAEFAPLRLTYFATAPLLLISAVLLLRFREPQLHKAEEREPLRAQIGATYRTILAGGHMRAIVALTVVGALLMQGMLEFGPLWLVALAVPPFLYGPHWAGLTGALGARRHARCPAVVHARLGGPGHGHRRRRLRRRPRL